MTTENDDPRYLRTIRELRALGATHIRLRESGVDVELDVSFSGPPAAVQLTQDPPAIEIGRPDRTPVIVAHETTSATHLREAAIAYVRTHPDGISSALATLPAEYQGAMSEADLRDLLDAELIPGG